MWSILADVEPSGPVWSDVDAMADDPAHDPADDPSRPEDLQATFCATLVDE